MTTTSDDGYSQACMIEPGASFVGGNVGMKNYLLESTKELNAISGRLSHGEAVDDDTRAWMLAQVDLIVEAIGNENLELGDELRSDLLQLLLAIANLNEQIRRQIAA
jgi:hypothetical protein